MSVAVQQHDPVADGIEGRLPLAVGELGRVLGASGAEEGSYRRKHLQRLRDVRQVAVGPALQPMHLVLDADERAGDVQHRDGTSGGIGLETATDLESVQVRQPDVKDDQIRAHRRHPQGFASRGSLLDRITRAEEGLGDGVSLGFVVIDEQDRGFGSIDHLYALRLTSATDPDRLPPRSFAVGPPLLPVT